MRLGLLRRGWRRLLVSTVALLAGGCAPATPPNIVLVLVDDLRHDSLGVTGQQFFETPNIDRLANEGAVFDQSFVITSLCTSSRASMMTGLYTHEHGIIDIWTHLDSDKPTIATSLQEAGYETAWIGKWHLQATDGPAKNFDYWVSYPVHGQYQNPTVNINGEESTESGHLTPLLADHMVEFLSQPRDAPFFLALSHSSVHTPYVPMPQFRGALDEIDFEPPPTFEERALDKPDWLDCHPTIQDLPRRIQGYYELLMGVELSVGRLLDTLSQQGVLDDTMIIFASDNGYYLGEHGLTDKRSAYEPSIRVPLFIRYPRWFRHGTIVEDGLALNLDIPSTILDAAGAEPLEGMRGISLHDFARGKGRDQFLYQYYQDMSTELATCTPTIRALRTERYKFVTYPLDPAQIPELYGLVEDPDETRNVVAEPDYRDVMEELSDRLSELRYSLGDSVIAHPMQPARRPQR